MLNDFFNLVDFNVFSDNFLVGLDYIDFGCDIYVVFVVDGMVGRVEDVGLVYIGFFDVICLFLLIGIQGNIVDINVFVFLFLVEVDQFGCLFYVVFIGRVVYVNDQVRCFKVEQCFFGIIGGKGCDIRGFIVYQVVSYFFGMLLQAVYVYGI